MATGYPLIRFSMFGALPVLGGGGSGTPPTQPIDTLLYNGEPLMYGDEFLTYEGTEMVDLAPLTGNMPIEQVGAVLRSAFDNEYSQVRRRFLEGFAAGSGHNYVVTGDSTRDNQFNEMIAYYTSQYAKINIAIYDNASSGQTARDWKNNVTGSTVQEAIDNTPGTGSTTIMEYSFGINDIGQNTQAEVKADILEGLDIYLAAKPDALIILATPNRIANINFNNSLDLIYNEISTERGYPLIDIRSITNSIHGNSDYYQDATHPNRFGSRRIVNYISDMSLPSQLKQYVSIPNDPLVTTPTDPLVATIQTGLWNTNDGSANPLATWRRLASITVEPNFVLRVTHQGNRTDVSFLGDSDTFIESTTTSGVSGEIYREITIPSGATQARFNLSNDGAAYDALNDTPIVEYAPVSSTLYLSPEQINMGLSLGLPIERSALVDGSGSTGTDGQRAEANGDNTFNWITP